MSHVVGTPNGKNAQQVSVEYDGPNGRQVKVFKGEKAAFQARSFYAKQFKAGANPRVVGGSR
jgi:hypothetical protein